MHSRWVRGSAVAVSLVTVTTAYGYGGEHALIEQLMYLGMASPESVDYGFAYPLTETASPQPVDPGFVPPHHCPDDVRPPSPPRIVAADASPES